MSGYSDNILSQNIEIGSSIPFMQKPFTRYEVGMRIKKLLNAGNPNVPKHLSMLMIDDDEDLRLLFSRQCKKQGHSLYEAESLASALHTLTSTVLDAVLIDLNFPDTDGITVLREIRKQGYKMPAIMVSGDISRIDLEALKPLGCIATLEKSHLISELVKQVERILL
jgi:CheY-like chemotaxis protein